MRTLYKILSVAFVSFGIAGTAAHADTLADWSFESTLPSSAGPYSPEVGAGSIQGNHASAMTVYSSPAGNGSSHSYSSTNWASGDYYQFSVSTLGSDDIALSFDQASSNTGPRDFELSYSTNGVTFTNFASYQVLANASPNPVWNGSTSSSLYTITENLSSIASLDNQGTVYFRLTDTDSVSANGGAVGTAGTDRLDNVLVSGAVAPVPLPTTALLLGGGLIGLMGTRRRRG
jgi:hypothetical protein